MQEKWEWQGEIWDQLTQTQAISAVTQSNTFVLYTGKESCPERISHQPKFTQQAQDTAREERGCSCVNIVL